MHPSNSTYIVLQHLLAKGPSNATPTELQTVLKLRSMDKRHRNAWLKHPHRMAFERRYAEARAAASLELLEAATAGKTETVRRLLKNGVARVDFNTGWPGDRQSPLVRAAIGGHANVVRALLDAGADTDVLDLTGTTAMVHAARRGYTDIVKNIWPRLKPSGNKRRSRNAQTSNAIGEAVRHKHADTRRWLVRAIKEALERPQR
jgi:ankyrin repeat protein